MSDVLTSDRDREPLRTWPVARDDHTLDESVRDGPKHPAVGAFVGVVTYDYPAGLAPLTDPFDHEEIASVGTSDDDDRSRCHLAAPLDDQAITGSQSWQHGVPNDIDPSIA